MDYLVAYDIADPGRLRKTARILQKYGTRIQKSLFECTLTESAFRRLQRELQAIVRPDDALTLWKLSVQCQKWRLCGKNNEKNGFFF